MKLHGLALAAFLTVCGVARADSLAALKSFVTDVKSGRAEFAQTVTSPDGAKSKKSNGSFEFTRPNRFRFDYTKPYAQTIVGDGQKVWLHDIDLNQITVRPFDRALGATPAALLAGGSIDKEFDLKALPDADGLQWVQALPKTKDGSFQSLKIGFVGANKLAAIEIVDAFGQRSRLDFKGFEPNAAVAAERLRFTPPAGVDVIAQ